MTTQQIKSYLKDCKTRENDADRKQAEEEDINPNTGMISKYHRDMCCGCSLCEI